MAIGKGLNAFLAAYYKAKESNSKDVYQAIQLAYLMNNLKGGIPKGADAATAEGEKGYKTVPYGGLREGRSAAVGDPVSTDMAPHQRAFLNAVAAPESGGEYDRMYAGMGRDVPPTYFEGYDQHPDISAPGPAGPSTAAGRYMFTKSTWDRMGGGAFDPANQDKRAWELAKQDYAERTGGRDLDKELRTNGFTPQIASTLSPTWTGFKTKPQLAADTYYSSLNRYALPQVAEGSVPSALPVVSATTATPALSAASLPPPRADNLGQALPVEAGVTAPTPTAYAPEAYPQAIPVDYAAYDPYNTEAVYAAKGGLVPDLRQRWVQHFQAGGEVEDNPDPTDFQALYTGAGDMGGTPTLAQPAQPTRQINNPVSALLDTASDAVTAGVKWLHDKFDVANASLSGIGEHPALRALTNHEGAAPAGDVQEVEDAVDPEKHMNAGARRLAGMNAAYQYYLAHGEETKAKAVAGSMIMYSKRVAAESADMALRAPNYIAGAKILAQGHNQIPGATQYQLDDNGNYIAKDPKTGKPIDAGVMSPQQVLAAARGLKDGSVFWRELSTYAKPDADEKTTAQQKLEAAQGAADKFNKVYTPPGGAIPTSPGGIPAAPTTTTAAATPAAEDDGDTSDEGRSAGTTATPTAPVETPAPVTAPVSTPPKPTAKAPTYGAYIGMSPNLSDTLKTKEQKDAWNTLQRDNPQVADRLQKEHERRVLYYGSLAAQEAAQEAAKTAPAPPPKEAPLNQGAIAKQVDEAATEHQATLEAQKQPVPHPAVVEQTKFLARNIAKHDPERRSGADGFDAAVGLMKAPFGMPGDKIPTSKDGKGPDLKEAMNMFAYKITKDKDGPYVVSKEDGTTIRMSQEGRLRLEKLLRDRAAKQWEVENEKKPSAYDFIPGWRKVDDASLALADRLKRGVSNTAGDIAQGAKDFGTAWVQRTAPEFQGAASAVTAVPGMIPSNLPGIPQLVQRGVEAIPTVPPGRLPQQVITAGAMNRPRMAPIPPRYLPQSAIPIPPNVPMPDWTLYPNDNP